ncbi:MAG: sigma-54-dependent Fis family transcriptional regulator [Gemmatimonadaceae bacterium]|nr:sigma-54-dependent Fis family transcriptional regulator [Gemmatimonadaceae bacterium]
MKVLVTLTDIEPAVRLNALLERDGIATAMVSPMDDLPSAVKREKPDLIVITGNLLDPPTQALVRQQLWDGAAVLGLADVGDRDLQLRLRAAGFSEVVVKPVPAEEVFVRVKALLDRRDLAARTGLYGESEAVREVLVKVEQMAPVSSTVLIEGESGTGKELVARAIHSLGPRRNKPFIAVNVGALPETLLESELFGHEKGAFTGAAERRIGRFELADGGTIFLDEIGDIPPSTQVKLLRVLEEREVTRVGGTQVIPVDVRVVAATNRPLRESVERGSFRSDLYYRLNVLSIFLPPLRARRDDIVLLVRRFVQEFSRAHDREFHGITPEAMQALVDYYWPGNVRELRNLVESMVVLAHGRAIGLGDIPEGIREQGPPRLLPVPVGSAVRDGEGARGRELEFIVRSLVELKLQVEELRRRVDDDRTLVARIGGAGGAGGAGGEGVVAGRAVGGMDPPGAEVSRNTVVVTPGMTMAQIERASIEAALRETRGNRRKAADLLDIGERTLYRKLKEYKIPLDPE